MAANYVLLEKITVGAAGASSVTFSGIPQTGYTDLVLRISARTTRSSVVDAISLSFNGLATNQTSIYCEGSGNATASGSLSSYRTLATSDTATANTFGNSDFYIPNYTSTNYKSASADGVSETNATVAYAWLTANLWSATAAITSISVTDLNSASFVQYSTFYLYGVAKLGTTPAIVPYATGGDTIMTDGTYWYHTFISSGTFTPQKGLSADYLVIAGGGAGNESPGGGGGAGGYRTSIGGPPLSLATSAYTVTIGAGGSGAIGAATSGSNSVFGSITSSGGGKGGQYYAAGTAGGSGGGGGSASGNYYAGGAGNMGGFSPVEGYAGGTPSAATAGFYISGGGGGSSAVGGNATGMVSGNGGAGTASSISGTSVTRAGGGGGGLYDAGNVGTAGTGGSGGGGNGAQGVGPVGTAGTVNTGSGGGGSAGGGGLGSGAGGSGIVIVRYAV